MVRFEELQELWQGQETPARPAVDAVALTRGLRAYGRGQNWLNAAKAALIFLQIGWMFLRLKGMGPFALAGAAIIAIGEVTFLALDWRAQHRIARSSFANPSVVFIDATIERLRRQRYPFGGLIWLLLGSVIVGLNLILWDGPRRPGGLGRLRIHAGATIFALLCFRGGLWVRARRFDAQCRPLIDQLAGMRRDLERVFQ